MGSEPAACKKPSCDLVQPVCGPDQSSTALTKNHTESFISDMKWQFALTVFVKKPLKTLPVVKLESAYVVS
jgi:hypothetical protein